MIARDVRLPLQTGRSASNRVLGSLFTGVPAMALMAALGHVLWTGQFHHLVAVLPSLGIFSAVTFFILQFAYQMRASDSVLTQRGLTIEGGRADRLSLPWSEINPDYSKVDVMIDPKRPDDPAPRVLLFLFPRTTDAIQIAETNDPDEGASFRALLECIRAACAGTPPPARRRETEAFVCARCGGLAVPADAADVPCHFCGARVVVPSDVRDRIRASRDMAVSPDAALAERLLKQPGASRINVLLTVGTLAFYGGASIAFLAAAEIGALIAGLAFLACVFAARALIADRGALRSLLLGFAAHAPSREGEPETCRACRAPLPAAAPGMVTLPCAYCGAMNLSGVDLRAEATVARSAEADLRAMVAHRAGRRRAAWAWFIATAGGLIAALVIARVYLLRAF